MSGQGYMNPRFVSKGELRRRIAELEAEVERWKDLAATTHRWLEAKKEGLEQAEAEVTRLTERCQTWHAEANTQRVNAEKAEAAMNEYKDELAALKARRCETCRRYETDTRLCQTMSQYHHPKFCCIHWEARP